MNPDRSTLHSRRRMASIYALGVYVIVPASLLLLLLGVAGIGTALFYCSIELIPVLMIYLFWGLGRGLYVGVAMSCRGAYRTCRPIPETEPALLIDEENQPGLYGLIRECCREARCPMPEQVALHATSEFMVTDSPLRLLNGTVSGICLIISLPMLRYLTTSELRAIIHHELAHAAGGDLSYMRKVRLVYSMIGTAAMSIHEELDRRHEKYSVSVLPLIAPLLLMQGYMAWFHRKDMKISQAQEVLADRRAAELAGSVHVAASLRKMEGVGASFHAYTAKLLTGNEREPGDNVDNLYLSFREEWMNQPEEERDSSAESMLNREAETHAGSSERIGFLAAHSESETDDREAALWIQELELLERKVTDLFYCYVNHDEKSNFA